MHHAMFLIYRTCLLLCKAFYFTVLPLLWSDYIFSECVNEVSSLVKLAAMTLLYLHDITMFIHCEYQYCIYFVKDVCNGSKMFVRRFILQSSVLTDTCFNLFYSRLFVLTSLIRRNAFNLNCLLLIQECQSLISIHWTRGSFYSYCKEIMYCLSFYPSVLGVICCSVDEIFIHH